MRSTSGKDWIWEPTREAIYHRDGDRCVACGARESFEKRSAVRYHGAASKLSLDHVIPGGGNRPHNLVTLCLSCNSSKGEQTIRKWKPAILKTVNAQLRAPLTRVEGRRRANILRPGRLASHAYRTSPKGRAEQAAKRAELLAEAPWG